MSNKFDALMTILNKLDQRERVTKQSLMDDLEVSERSAYRYVQILQNSGFRIRYERQKKTYSFEDGFSLAKPNVSLEETLAISLAKRMLGTFGTGMERSLSNIEDKLTLKQTGLPNHIILKASGYTPLIDSHLGALHQAIVNFQKVEIVYKALHSDEESRRKNNPHYLFFNEGFWYLRGYCHTSKGMRTFALDRIVTLKILTEHFLPKAISPEEELKNGMIEMRFTVKGLGGIKKWIYQWIPHVKIIAPISLKKEMRHDIEQMKTKL